jgi:hypothetical protein
VYGRPRRAGLGIVYLIAILYFNHLTVLINGTRTSAEKRGKEHYFPCLSKIMRVHAH